MWRDRNRYDDHGLVPDTFWLLVAVVLFAACGLVWLIGQVAAILLGPTTSTYRCAWSTWTSPREVDTGVMRPWVMVAG